MTSWAFRGIPLTVTFNSVIEFSFAAFVTHEGKGHFVVWDHLGNECQRFYLFNLHRFNILSLNQHPYSPYHMSDYSFKDDVIFFGLVQSVFYVLTENKYFSYQGEMHKSYDVPVYASSHMSFNSSSRIWLIGGSTLDFDHGYALFSYNNPAERAPPQSRIIDLEWVNKSRNKLGINCCCCCSINHSAVVF